MQQAAPTLAALDVRVLVVTFEPTAAAADYVAETDCPWPVVSDESRALYGAYAMRRVRLRHLVGPSTWAAYWRELRQGVFPRRPAADTFQQGGDILIDPAGIARFVHVGTGPGDRPTVASIMRSRRLSSGARQGQKPGPGRLRGAG